MKYISVFTVLLIANTCYGGNSLLMAKAIFGEDIENENAKFVGSYDGWGTWTLPGIGKNTEAGVKCGNIIVPIREIIDTHQSKKSHLYERYAEVQESYNKLLLVHIKEQGVECTFK